MRPAAAAAEVVLRSAKISGAFLSRGGDELDGPLAAQANSIYSAREGEHDRESPPIVVDPRADEASTIAPYRQVGARGKYSVEVRADDHGRQVVRAWPPADHITRCVCMDVGEAALGEAAADPSPALCLAASGRRDLRDGDLRAHYVFVTSAESGVRGGERVMRANDV
jgi:hypothetical protein